MGYGEATSGSEMGGSTGWEPTTDQVGSKKYVGDTHKNTKGKWSHHKEKGLNPKAITTHKFEVIIEELKGHVFNLHGLDKAEKFNWATKKTTEYVDRELDPLAGKALRNLKVPIISKPKNTYMYQGEWTMYDVNKSRLKEDIKEYVKEKRI